MHEKIVIFGDDNSMFGIHAIPEPSSSQTALVLVNSGIVHRVGANRNTVTMARKFASVGYPSLRFDMSGLGDAPDRQDNLGWEASSPLEISTAVNAFSQISQAQNCILYGNCGGAAKSFWASLREPKVSGLLLTNPPPHPHDEEFGSEVEKYAHGRLISPDIPLHPISELASWLEKGRKAKFIYSENDVGEAYFWRRLAPHLGKFLDEGSLEISQVENTNHTLQVKNHPAIY